MEEAMTLKRAVFNILMPLLKNFFGDERQANLSLALVPTISVDTPHGPILFYSPNSRTVLEAKRLMSLEPGTISWIDGFRPEATFWDVGANSGLYTLYAALSGAAHVMAFEPASPNIFLVNKNIEINKLSDKVKLFGIAFSDKTCICDLVISDTQFSTASCSITLNKNPMININHSNTMRQAVISFSIDNFREQFSIPAPNYIKIDVDGAEDIVLKGAIKTLNDPNLKSIQVEVDVLVQPTYETILDLVKSTGLVARNIDELERAISDAQARAARMPEERRDRVPFDIRFYSSSAFSRVSPTV